jgi:hypothetical protein
MTRLLFLPLFVISFYCDAQEAPAEEIKKTITIAETQAQVEFLASDEFKGRDTGSPELNIAANYIVSIYQRNNVKPVKGNSYFQQVPFLKSQPPTETSFKVGDKTFTLKQDLLRLNGGNGEAKGDVVFAGYGSKEDFAKINAKGKIVITFFGSENENNFAKALLTDSPGKNKLAKAAGASALIEISTLPGIPFPALAGYIHKERMMLKYENEQIIHMLMRSPEEDFLKQLKERTKMEGTLTVKGVVLKEIESRNVIGIIEGTDPQLKKEILVLTAHYDHVGIGKKTAEQDSIFNGARDNALGTVALLSAVKYLSQNPLKRSVLFIAFTAEEKGLLGSLWYADHPLVPLKNSVFNLNADGGGYNDKTMIVVNGFEYTNSKRDVENACKPFDLIASPDPVPQQNLYSASDNFPFAVKGVPAINFAPGFKGFDEEILKYYHKQDDETDSLDYEYLIKYFRSYVNLAQLLGNSTQTPGWLPGTKFEKTGMELYGK